MFEVVEVRRGLFRDKATIVATADASHTRNELGWDHTGAPTVEHLTLEIRRGDQFEIAVPRNGVAAGQAIGPEQVARWPGFASLWRSAG